MIYKLKQKDNALKYLLGDIDWMDISYILQSDNKASYNNLLICMNDSMLNILYKYDQFSPQFEMDWTDAGTSECVSYNMEFISDNMVKVNIVQKFVRCFSFYKETQSINQESGTNLNSTINYISLYPNLFLDYENKNLDNILSTEEKDILRDSKVLNVEYNTSGGF